MEQTPDIAKTVGIDTLYLSIPIGKKLFKDNFVFGAKYNHQEIIGDVEDASSAFQDNIVISWPEGVRGYCLPEVLFRDYPHWEGGRHYEYLIRIASLPKILYGNNITEIPESSFEEVLDELYRLLGFLELPLAITKKQLRTATVRRVDYGKNIIFQDGTTMLLLGELLSTATIRNRSNAYGMTKFRRGEMFSNCIKERKFIVYDKLADYTSKEKNSKPAYSNSDLQFNPEKLPPDTQIVRLETQIQTTKQLKIELNRMGFPKDAISFADIFSSDIASKILLYHWNSIRQTIHLDNTSDLINGPYLLQYLAEMAKNGKGGPTKIFGKLGFNLLVNTCGLNTVRKAFKDYLPNSDWSKTRKSLLIEASLPNSCHCLEKITKDLEIMQCISGKELENA